MSWALSLRCEGTDCREHITLSGLPPETVVKVVTTKIRRTAGERGWTRDNGDHCARCSTRVEPAP